MRLESDIAEYESGLEPPASVQDSERIYPCSGCGKMRTAAEGGSVFVLCEECWETKNAKA